MKRSGDDKVRFDIETKVTPDKPDETLAPEPFARALVEEIRKAGMAARAQIQSFDWRTLQVVQKIAPEIDTVYLTRAAALRQHRRRPARGLALDRRVPVPRARLGAEDGQGRGRQPSGRRTSAI